MKNMSRVFKSDRLHFIAIFYNDTNGIQLGRVGTLFLVGYHIIEALGQTRTCVAISNSHEACLVSKKSQSRDNVR